MPLTRHTKEEMSRWSPEQVRKAAPDESSLKAARKLALAGPWSETGATENLLFGKCQGSGKKPYQVSIDLVAPAYRCSCPSRKFPCKHALALLMLWADGNDIADVSDASEFAQQWANERADRSAQKAAKAATKKDVDPVAREKRRQARLTTMDDGVADFSTWLHDVMRSGIAATRSHPTSFFDTAAARLVDAQCPALATEVRDLPTVLYSGDKWASRTAETLGRWWTIVNAWQRRDTLSEHEVADVRAALGWAWPTDEIREREQVNDEWVVLGVYRHDDGRLAEQRTWLQGSRGGTTVLVLAFATAGQPLPVPQATGARLSATVAMYPGSAPARALFIDEPSALDGHDFPVGVTMDEALTQIAEHRAIHPLALRTPLVLRDVRLTTSHVIDDQGAALPLIAPSWDALAVSGGHPVTVFGEWSRSGFTPLTVVADGQVMACE